MTENEYLVVTDLVKLRLALHILSDSWLIITMPTEGRANALQFLFDEIDRLEALVETTG